MGLDISKLENVKKKRGKRIAKCPACAEMGQDKKGEHLFIDNRDRFGCVTYPGETGKDHRKRIYALVGMKTNIAKCISVKNNIKINSNIIIENVLGHLGRQNLTSYRKNLNDKF